MSLLGNEFVKEYNIENDLKNIEFDIEIKNRFKKICWNGIYECLEKESVCSQYKVIEKFDNLKSAINWLKEI